VELRVAPATRRGRYDKLAALDFSKTSVEQAMQVSANEHAVLGLVVEAPILTRQMRCVQYLANFRARHHALPLAPSSNGEAEDLLTHSPLDFGRDFLGAWLRR
jgi:hypothetical protein